MQTCHFKQWLAHGLKIDITRVLAMTQSYTMPTILISSSRHLFMTIKDPFSANLLSLQPSGTCYAQFQAPPTFYVCIYVCTFQLNIHIAKDSIIYTFQHSKSITNPFMHIHCVSKSKCGSVSLIKISRNFINQNFNEQTLTLIDNRSLSKNFF